jgi:hypothetical protein
MADGARCGGGMAACKAARRNRRSRIRVQATAVKSLSVQDQDIAFTVLAPINRFNL